MPRIEEDIETGTVIFTAPYYDLPGLLRAVAGYIEQRVSRIDDLDIRLGEPVPGDETPDMFRHRAILWVATWKGE